MKNYSLFGKLIILFISLFLGCYRFPNDMPDFQREISVIGILDTSGQPQKIYLYYTSELEQSNDFVMDATVTINNGLQQVVFTLHKDVIEYPKYYYYDYPDTLRVLPGMTYKLKVTTSEDDSLCGITTVPESFNIINPVNGETLQENSVLNLKLKWSKSYGSYGYIINIVFPKIEYNMGSNIYYHQPFYSYQTNDTTYAVSDDRIILDEGKYTIKIMAYDQNYHYHHEQGIVKSGVKGGYGFFASAVVDSVSFYVK